MIYQQSIVQLSEPWWNGMMELFSHKVNNEMWPYAPAIFPNQFYIIFLTSNIFLNVASVMMEPLWRRVRQCVTKRLAKDRIRTCPALVPRSTNILRSVSETVTTSSWLTAGFKYIGQWERDGKSVWAFLYMYTHTVWNGMYEWLCTNTILYNEKNLQNY